MATQIQFKRGLNANFPTVTLKGGEPAFITDLGKLYVGDGTKKVLINPIDKPSGINTENYFTKFKVNDYGQIINTENTSASDIPDLPYSKITGLGTVATLNTGINSGNVPVLDSNGKLVSSILPPLAITDTFVVSSEAAMLALAAEVGDIAVRTDIKETFILHKEPASEIANWIKLLTPTDSVLSVNGQTGVVNLTGNNMLLTGYIKPASFTPILAIDSTTLAIGKLETNFANYAPLLSPTLTGTPMAPTPAAGNDTTQIATTSFVQTAIATIDGGTF